MKSSLISLTALFLCLNLTGQESSVLQDINAELSSSINNVQQPKREFRAAWVTTFTNLDWPSKRGLSAQEQQREYLSLLEQFKNSRLNAVIVQVRPSSDAFYPSEYSPWSEWLAGAQGNAPVPYYDPLAFMLEHTHRNSMEFHAWFNPLRAVSHDRFSSISTDHITKKKPEWFFHYGESYYYNPGIPEVREYLIKVVMEVVKNYDIDGVHLDDYFYPYTIKGQKIPDWSTYKKYGRGIKNIEDWRRNNINLFIEELSKEIKKQKPWVKFGISPLAIWRNKRQDPQGSDSNSGQTSYDNLYCDTKLWVEKGWMDYVAPQLYWPTNNLYANYNNLLKWWNLQTNQNTHLYIGHALYKLSLRNKHRFSCDELCNQVKLSRTNSRAQGSIYFRAKTFKQNPGQFQSQFRTTIYQSPAIIPTMPWIDNSPPPAPNKLEASFKDGAAQLNWRPSFDPDPMNVSYYYAVYRFEGIIQPNSLDSQHLIEITRNTVFLDFDTEPNTTYTYVVTALDRMHNESIKFVSGTVKTQ